MNNFTQRKRYLGSIGVPSVVNAIFDRTLSTPDDFFLKVGGDGASLPPVLVPFWGDLDGSDGVWQHWFCNRKATIVSALHEFSFLVFEDARTLDQFVDDWILTCIEGDEGVGEDARRLARHFGRSDETLEWLDQFSIDLGERRDLPAFASETPLTQVASLEQYDGDFPTPVLAHRARWDFCCEIEARGVLENSLYKKDPARYAEGAAAWLAHVEASPWLKKDTDKPDVFRHYLEKEDWARAWLSINAHGWKLSQVSDALHELDRRTRAPGFDLLVAAWHEMLPQFTARDYY
ncbi:MAG: hypothetical protein JNJ83_08840 [Verrucomicrobiaceae bacterium]|nr:hypothetical protein [Verrucomicrobiaceae bacterium]